MLGALVAFKTAEYVWKAKKLNDPNGPHAEMVNSAKTKLAKCRDGVAQCIDGAGRFVDEQTGGKYTDNITSGVGIAKNLIGSTPGDDAQQNAPSDGSDAPSSPDEPDEPDQAAKPAKPGAVEATARSAATSEQPSQA